MEGKLKQKIEYMIDLKHVEKIFAETADDFFVMVLLAKVKDYMSQATPFIHAHILELSSKSAGLNLGIDITKFNHKIIGLYEEIEIHRPGIKGLVPTPQDFVDYKNFWVSSSAPNNNVTLPNPNNMHMLELAYFLDNVADLKYGFRRDMKQVSVVQVAYEGVNLKFIELFRHCRDVYATPHLNGRLTEKLVSIFGEGDDVKKFKVLLHL